MNLRNEVIRMMVLLIFVAVGMMSMMLPNPEPYVGIRMYVVAALIAAALLIVYGSFADRRDRNRILRDQSSRRASDPNP